MTTVAEVRLWGSRIAAVSMPDEGGTASFQYDPDFVTSGIQVAPLTMPLNLDPYTFPALSEETFRGLPGLLADSLPDRFGHAVINAWLAGQGRSPDSFNAVERLCYIGRRGMGALEFSPPRGPQPEKGHDLRIEALVELASEVLAHRQQLVASLAEGHRRQAMQDILSVGTSAGGARAKAVIAFNPVTEVVRSGQLELDPGFEHWLVKFDGVVNNKDKDTLADPQGYGAVEFAYSLMARDIGIVMTECRLLEEGGRRHFMTRRFDRGRDGSKRHMQSLGALAHLDFNQPGANSYEQAFDAMRRLGLPHQDIEQLFVRMVFNIVARNQDDHVKNIAFLMDRAGVWSLAPAFDMTYAYRPSSRWTGQHQMSVNGKRDEFALEDFDAAGRVAALPQGRARRIVHDVVEVVSQWDTYAERVNVNEELHRGVAAALRLQFPDTAPRSTRAA
ncbi:MAG TPA: type II toxin-antitoxin system HipA family toxin [Solirubrobacteraceae bacterium]|nr:type II toxin-antitoxin system HipA family toxin [Solirubrobacteraceae bacterium]